MIKIFKGGFRVPNGERAMEVEKAEEMVARHYPKPEIPKEEVHCDWCDEVVTTVWEVRMYSKTNRFCDQACELEWLRAYHTSNVHVTNPMDVEEL